MHVVGSFIHSCSFYIIVYEFLLIHEHTVDLFSGQFDSLLIFGSWTHSYICKYYANKTTVQKKIIRAKQGIKKKLKYKIGY